MPTPFPGMDPYLEHPELWSDVHHGLIEALRDALVPRLRPRYRVSIEKRTYIAEPEGLMFVGRPDVSVIREKSSEEPEEAKSSAPSSGPSSAQPSIVTVPVPYTVSEGYLEVRDVSSGEVITSLEVLSPANKRPGAGQQVYEAKRHRVLASLTHLVEIDLLRAGEPPAVEGRGRPGLYGILVSRSQERPRAHFWSFSVRQPIPAFPLPLRPGDPEPLVELQALVQALYDRAGYDLAIDYNRPAEPPLEEVDSDWADALLRRKGLR